MDSLAQAPRQTSDEAIIRKSSHRAFKIQLQDNICMSGRSLVFVGHIPRTDRHRHCSETWLFGLDGPLQVDLGPKAQRMAGTNLVIPRGVEHVLDAPDTRVGVVLVDPLRPGSDHNRITRHPLNRDWNALLSGPALTASDVGQLLAEAAEPGNTLDRRVLGAAQWLDDHLSRNAPLDELAASLGLSGSRMQHLFVAQTGLRLRQYRTWMRLIKAARDAGATGSMTRAAYDNGFSNPSHLSSTFSNSFGITAASLLFGHRKTG